ncbi:MAG: response regulator transcription factor [Alphaproteobacteria bacterium]|nr:response regulator transcription factor [Alphaproteobacteria bacterium]
MKENKLSNGNTYHLTPQQMKALNYLAQGLRNKEIANRMKLSESTIKQHVSGIMLRLGVNTRTAVVVKAQELGLIRLTYF